MRLLRLDLGTGHSVDLHPFVTLVSGLEPEQERELVEAIRRVATGTTTAVRGLVQHQGLLVELDGAGQVRLGPPTEVDVVIDTDVEGDTNLKWLRDRLDDQLRRAEIAAARVEELRADLDPTAQARLDDIAARLAPTGSGPVPAHASHCQAVERALQILETLPRVAMAAPPEAEDLRSRVADHERRASDAADHLNRLEEMVGAAEERARQARRRLAAAELAATPVLLTAAEEQRLELLSFPAMDESRRGRWRKVLRSEEEAEKQALLDKVGVESWTAYTVYRVAPSAPRGTADALEVARAEAAEVERFLADIEAKLATDPRRRDLEAEREVLHAEARSLLGPVLPADLELALAALRVERVTADWQVARDELAGLMDVVGVDGHLDDDDLIEAAGRWLARAQADAVDDAPTLDDHERAERDLSRHERALSRLDAAEAQATEAVLGLARLQERLAAVGVDEAGGVDTILDRVEPAAVQASLEGNGPVPVVLVGELPVSDDAEVERLMSRVSGMTDDLQVIVISGRTAVEEWVAGVGLDRAMVARPQRRISTAA